MKSATPAPSTATASPTSTGQPRGRRNPARSWPRSCPKPTKCSTGERPAAARRRSGSGSPSRRIGARSLSGVNAPNFSRSSTRSPHSWERATGLNANDGVWRLPDGRSIQFGGVANLGDEVRYQGSPRDLLILDEAANLLESQARFLLGWLRSTDPGQRCRALLCSNPPTSAEGEWLIRWFAPWLDPGSPVRAAPGELRWVAMVDGAEVWVNGPEPFVHRGEVIRPSRGRSSRAGSVTTATSPRRTTCGRCRHFPSPFGR